MLDLHTEITEGEPQGDDKKIVIDGMLEYHASKGYPRKTDYYNIFLKNENGKSKAAIFVSFLWNGMSINTLWVDESLRGQGLGRKMVEMVEREAVKRGCTLAYTDTFSWQSPDFYKKIGYKLYGQLDDFPEGNTLYYFKKKLV